MAVPTTNYGLEKPDVNNPDDQDIWGNYLNGDMDELDGLMATAIKFQKSSQTSSFSVASPTTGSASTGDSKKFFLCDATSGNIVATLPTAASAGDGFTIAFKKMDAIANTITVTANGTEKIDGSTTFTISVQYNFVVLVCDGTQWNIQSQAASTAGLAPLASPAFTGVPTAPSASGSTNTPQIATTNQVQAALTVSTITAKAWATFDGTSTGTNAPISGFGITSITRNGTGDYTVNLTTAQANINYSYTVGASAGGTTAALYVLYNSTSGGSNIDPTVSAFRFSLDTVGGGAVDRTRVYVHVFGT